MKYTVAELADVFAGALRELAAVFTMQRQPWMLVGGLAIGGWTEPRATRDCDFAIALPSDAEPLASALRQIGFDIPPDAFASAIDGGPVRLHLKRADAPPLSVDLLCAGTAFELEALARRRALEILGVPMFVASPDDLLIYKLVAGRPQDLADIDRLIRFGRVPEDETYVRRWAHEWEVEELLDKALAAARRDET